MLKQVVYIVTTVLESNDLQLMGCGNPPREVAVFARGRRGYSKIPQNSHNFTVSLAFPASDWFPFLPSVVTKVMYMCEVIYRCCEIIIAFGLYVLSYITETRDTNINMWGSKFYF
jgi:hypothetical protein